MQLPLRRAAALATALTAVLLADGEVWIAQASAGTIGRMTPGGAFGRETLVRSGPDSVTIGPDGDLWYASSEGAVGRVDSSR